MTNLKLPNIRQDIKKTKDNLEQVTEMTQFPKLENLATRSPSHSKSYKSTLKSQNLVVIAVLAVITLALSGVALVSYKLVRNLILESLKQKALVEVQQGKADIDKWLATRKAEVNLLAGSPLTKSMDWATATPYLQTEVQRLGDYYFFLIAQPDGSYFTTKAKTVNAKLSDREYFKQAMAGNIFVSDPLVSRSLGVPLVPVAAPIRQVGEDGIIKVIGAFSGNIPVERINRVVGKLQYGQGSYAFALNSKGEVIFHPNPAFMGTIEKPAPSLSKTSQVNLQQIARQMVDKVESVELTQLDGKGVYVAFSPLKEANWSIALVIPQENIESQLSYLNLLAAITTVMLIIALLGAISIVRLFNKTQSQVDLLDQQSAELNQALGELKQAHTHLVQSEKMSSLGQLVAGVAHEINNPVNFIHGNLSYINNYTESLLRLATTYGAEYPEPTEKLQALTEEIDLPFILEDFPKVINSIEIGAERIRSIVQSLRTFSRIDESDKKSVNIHEGLDSTLLILQHRFKTGDLHLGIQIVKEYGELPLVDCYPSQLNQVFMNLISNALDALEETGRSPKQLVIKTDLVEVNNNKFIQIAIADNGDGIPAEMQAKIFDPFFTTKPVGKGTGLGLAISYQIVAEKHQGQIYVHNSALGGAEFVVEIPVQFQVKPSNN